MKLRDACKAWRRCKVTADDDLPEVIKLGTEHGEVALQILIWGKEGLEELYAYAATPNRLATNFACPCESLPANVRPDLCVSCLPLQCLLEFAPPCESA